MRTKVAVATAALLLALTGCGAGDEDADPTAETTTPAAEDAAPDAAPTPPAPDLEGLPDVVAVVDGVEVTREDFEQVYEFQLEQAFMQSQMSGQPVDQDTLKQQTAEGLVEVELLLAEAEARSIAPTEEEIDAAAQELAASRGLATADELFAALEEEGLPREEAQDQLVQQTALDQLAADEAGEYTPSEEEARALYDEAAAQGGDELPEFEEVRPQIEAQLAQEHENEAVLGLVTQLRESAEITYHL